MRRNTGAPAPIALFVYNRPSHTEQTMIALRENAESRDSDLVVFSDGPRSAADESKVLQTRAVIADLSGFRSARVVHRSENWGLARSIISGVSEILASADRIIVLEDDMVTSPQFLNYVNTALDMYSAEPAVACIHAYMFPIEGLPRFFFMRGGDCWGWATWRDRWNLMDQDGTHLLRVLHQKGLLGAFNKTGGDCMARMLIDQIRGKNSSWAIRWHASLFAAGKLTLQPGRSFVRNIGLDSFGTHCEATNQFDVVPEQEFSGLPQLAVVEDHDSVEKICQFHEGRRKSRWYRRAMRQIVDEVQMRKIIRYG